MKRYFQLVCATAFRHTLPLALMLPFLAANCGAQTPSINGLNPTSAAAGSAAFTLTVNGANFQTGSFVAWNGNSLATTFVSASQLNANVPSNLTTVPGFFFITVSNPGGVQSNGLYFTLTAVPLSISTTALASGTVGVAYSQDLGATGGVTPYAWSPVTELPPGLSVLPSGSISGTPTASGSFNLTIRVTDAQQFTTSKSFTLTIAPPALSIATTSPLPAGTAGQPYTLTLIGAGGTPPYSWSVGQGLPPGLLLDPKTGILAGTPTATGVFNFPVQITDSAQGNANRNFALTINPPPLTIATLPPLFSGTVGTPYVQTFAATGGVPPYRWTIVSGNTGDLKLDPISGALQGTPQSPGTFSFTIQVSDNVGTAVTRPFSVVVNPPFLTITTAAALPGGTVGVSYAQRFSVVGGTAPYSWNLTSGTVPGLVFDAAQATLSGIPATPGTFSFSLQVRDSGGLTATRTFTVEIAPAPLVITTGTELPSATLGSAYSQQINATGGVLPYTWSANGLPDGLTIDPNTGVISGVLNAAGSLSFTIRVIDNARSTAVNLFRINVGLPPLPAVSITGLPATAGPAQQFALRVTIARPYPVLISAQAILSFSPDAGGGDGTIQFASGGTTANFTIPIGSTEPALTAPLAIQTGTVAGTISVSLRLQAGGLDVTPSPAPITTTHVDRAAPVIQSARVIRNATGFSIESVGFSTAREVTQATYTFRAASGQSLQVQQVTIPLESVFTTWYQDPANTRYGSQFILSQPFTVQGDATAVIPETVTFTNRVGSTTVNLSQ